MLDGTGFFNDIEVNDDELTSESMMNKERIFDDI
jgi:hypothetical protein